MVDIIKQEIQNRIDFCQRLYEDAVKVDLHNTAEANDLLIRNYKSLLKFIDDLEYEHSLMTIREAAEEYASEEMMSGLAERAFRDGAKWAIKRMRNTIRKAYDIPLTPDECNKSE